MFTSGFWGRELHPLGNNRALGNNRDLSSMNEQAGAPILSIFFGAHLGQKNVILGVFLCATQLQVHRTHARASLCLRHSYTQTPVTESKQPCRPTLTVDERNELAPGHFWSKDVRNQLDAL